jgi:hypothetical protein
LNLFLGGQHALGPFRAVELSFEIIIRCFEPPNLLFIVCIATDWQIAAHIVDCRRMLIRFLEPGSDPA